VDAEWRARVRSELERKLPQNTNPAKPGSLGEASGVLTLERGVYTVGKQKEQAVFG